MKAQITWVRQAPSTNSLMAADAPALSHGAAIATLNQTAGRGQRGNSWEAAPGLNITLSLLLRPESLEPARQFAISQIVALATAITAADCLPEALRHRVTVKWPNDIYFDDRKLAGILIENSLTGSRIDRSIAGIGLNVNQPRFLSDAPNPVSLRQITGREFDISALADRLCENILSLYDRYSPPAAHQTLHDLYMSRLWRRTGLHPYRDIASGRTFNASVSAIGPMGHLTLREPSGLETAYAFKEVAAIID